jgi:hypothetical protein
VTEVRAFDHDAIKSGAVIYPALLNVPFTFWPSWRIRAPGANHSRAAFAASSFLDLVRCRSDRLRHDRRSLASAHSVESVRYAAASVGGSAAKSTSCRQTAQMIRASLLASALTALLYPRRAARSTTQRWIGVRRSACERARR